MHRRVALFSDISEKEKNEELIWQQANFDFLWSAEPAHVLRAARPGDQENRPRPAVGGADVHRLDRFKEVNDTLGHDIGDLLLKGPPTGCATACAKPIFSAGWGGDEFAIILGEQEDPANIDRIAQKFSTK